jgi:hypothetical protein
MKILLISIFVAGFIGCHQPTNDEKARKLIDDNRKKVLAADAGYEPLTFSKCDSAFTHFYKQQEYINAMHFVDSIKRIQGVNLDLIGNIPYTGAASNQVQSNYLEKNKQLDTVIANILEPLKAAGDKFIPVFTGWTMTHSYKSMSYKGITDVTATRYYFNKNLDSIISVADIAVNDPEDEK